MFTNSLPGRTRLAADLAPSWVGASLEMDSFTSYSQRVITRPPDGREHGKRRFWCHGILLNGCEIFPEKLLARLGSVAVVRKAARAWRESHEFMRIPR